MPNEHKFVDRVEMAIMQYVIVAKAKDGGVTRENLQQTFRNDLQFQRDHLDHCIRTLEQDGHIRMEGNRITATEDGREDAEKLAQLVNAFPQVVARSGGEATKPPAGGQQPTTTGQRR